MPDGELQTRGIPATDVVEKRSRDVFQSKLLPSEALFVPYGDKVPNLDGHIEFFGQFGSTTVKLFFQLKGTEQDITWYDADIMFLNYCYKSREPTFLILVNLPRNKVYWVHIDQDYIVSGLGIKDIAAFNQKTKRISFTETQTVDGDSAVLSEPPYASVAGFAADPEQLAQFRE